jgi:hypothetical protein
MKQQTLMILGLVAAAVVLSACGEQPQVSGGSRYDAAPYAGVGESPFQQPGWKAGDKTSWEQQLKARAQYGMNDYSRVATQ